MSKEAEMAAYDSCGFEAKGNFTQKLPYEKNIILNFFWKFFYIIINEKLKIHSFEN